MPGVVPFKEDFFERIINVTWGGGAFSFAGYISLNVVTPPTEFAIGQSTPHSTWLGGTSSDGKQWESKQSEAGLDLFCCVRGKVGESFVTIAAGDIVVGPFDFGPSYTIAWSVEPAGGVSDDDGLTWRNANVPEQAHVLKPPDTEAGTGAHTASGFCNAVAYHPGTETFYIGGSVSFSVGPDAYLEDRMYRGTGNGFSQVYSERRGLSAPFRGYRWPEVVMTPSMGPADRLRVADMTQTTKPGPGTLFVVSFGPKQHAEYVTTEEKKSYVAVKADGSGAILGGKDIFPPMAVVNSVCGGIGHIVAVGWEDEDERTGPVTFVSDDDGASWVAQLPGLKHKNPGPGDVNNGESSGSCSFSLKS